MKSFIFLFLTLFFYNVYAQDSRNPLTIAINQGKHKFDHTFNKKLPDSDNAISGKNIYSLDPPKNLQFSVNGSDVNLNWQAPVSGETEWLYYHDNTFEESFSSTNGGSGLAQQFSLSSAPATLTKIRFATSGFQLWGQPLSVYVLDGYGNNVLGGPYVANGVEYDWVEIQTSVYIEDNLFMIATYNDKPNGPYVAVDNSYYNGSLFFGNHFGGFTELSLLGDLYFVGSHQAEVEYAKRQGETVTEWIMPVMPENVRDLPVRHKEDKPFNLFVSHTESDLMGYNIYRDGNLIDSTLNNSTMYTDSTMPNGTYEYGVSAVYSDGESVTAGPVSVNVNNQVMPQPSGLTGSVNGNRVDLNWIGPGGSNEELVYDNGISTGAYSYPGYTMSVHFSPSNGPCQVLMLKYRTFIYGQGSNFHARIFDWYGTEPGNILWNNNTIHAIDGWLELNISDDNLMVDGDFVAGFASLDTMSFLGYDTGLSTGRSWDYHEASETWTTVDEAYLIRAVVQYGDGTKEVLNNKRNLAGYNLYRNNIKVNTSLILNTHTTDNLPGWGEYKYNVTAVYAGSQSAFSNDFYVNYYYGISEQKKYETKIYPNPASDYVHIRSIGEIEKVMLYQLDGKVVYQSRINARDCFINISNFDQGLYFIRLQYARLTQVFKIIKK